MKSAVYADALSSQDNLEWQPAQVVHVGDRSYVAERRQLSVEDSEPCAECGVVVARGYIIRVLASDYTWDTALDDQGQPPIYCGLNCVTEALKTEWRKSLG